MAIDLAGRCGNSSIGEKNGKQAREENKLVTESRKFSRK